MKKAVKGKSFQANHSLLALDIIVPLKMKNLCLRPFIKLRHQEQALRTSYNRSILQFTSGVVHEEQLNPDLIYEPAIKRITDLSARMLSLNYFKSPSNVNLI